MKEVIVAPTSHSEWTAREDLKWYLRNKYRTILVDKLSRGDFQELKISLRQLHDTRSGSDREHLHRFVLKLEEYLQEDVLKQEIAGIVSLVMLMKPEDLG
jgi:hypothetical protein